MRKTHIGLLAALLTIGCQMTPRSMGVPPETRTPDKTVELEVTAYCSCGDCCNWRHDWRGRTVVKSGPSKGRVKEVGLTSTGTRAAVGSIAADPSVFPYGTVLHIPGYGFGKVVDTGSAMGPKNIDVYFRHHQEANQWGRQNLQVRVWKPTL